MGRTAGILLAAGESRRMGFTKALLKLRSGDTFLSYLSAAMLPAVDQLIVVVGAHKELVSRELELRPDYRISQVENPDYARGQLSSLKVALGALAADVSFALVHLIDQPLVSAATFAMVAKAAREEQYPISIARYNGRRGHPVCFARAVFDELLQAPDSVGARAVVNRDAGRVRYVDVDDSGVTLDLDTPDDLARAGLPPPPASKS